MTERAGCIVEGALSRGHAGKTDATAREPGAPRGARPGITLSVVIPSFNGKDLLETCLCALARATAEMPEGSVETVVVDDFSSDGTREWLAGRWNDVRCVRLERNRGFAGAANAGIAASRGEWVAILNNDAVADAKWMSAAARHFDDGTVGCVASCVVSRDRDTIESAGDGYTVAGLAYQGANGRKASGRRGAYRVFSACAAAAFYRRRVLEEVGAFEERFESYYEDVDLGFRLNLEGWHTICEPASVAYHMRGRSYGKNPWRTIRNSSRNSEIVYLSCMPGRLFLRSLPAHLMAGLAQCVLRATQGRLLAFLAGKLAFALAVPWALRRRRRIQANPRGRAVPAFEGLIEREWFDIHVARRFHFPTEAVPTPEAQ